MTDATIAAIRCRTLKVSDKTEWTFVEVECSDGIVGIGEASLNAMTRPLAAHAAQLAAVLVGVRAMPNAVAPLAEKRAGGIVQRSVVSAIEQALWDALGKRLGMPVADLLGGPVRDSVPAYANVNRRTGDRSPEGFAQSARLAVEAGFTFVKIAPFDGVGEGDALATDTGVAAGLARIGAVCEAVGDGVRVLVDCHWRLDEASAARVLAFAADCDLYWIECPIPEHPAMLGAMQRLKRHASSLGVRIAGMERGLGLDDFRPAIEHGLADVIMPDVKYDGGLAETVAIARLAATAGIHVALHNPTGPVCHAASVALSAMLANCLILETQFDETPHFAALSPDLPAISNGHAALSTAPGLGVSLDEALVRELEVR